MSTPILGREHELGPVLALVDDETPSARAVVLSGEAGIGKTLWRAGVRHARERGLRTLVAHPAAGEAGLPYSGLADPVATVPDEALDARPEQQRAARNATTVAALTFAVRRRSGYASALLIPPREA